MNRPTRIPTHTWTIHGEQRLCSSPNVPAMKKKTPTGIPPLVVAPPAPTAEVLGAVPLAEQPGRNIEPLTERDHPGARGVQGKASRSEVRHEVHRIAAPRESLRPAERARQPRSHKPQR